MSIDKIYKPAGVLHIPSCDICGESLPPEFDYYDAIRAMKAAGWGSQQTDGGWENICPVCQSGGDTNGLAD